MKKLEQILTPGVTSRQIAEATGKRHDNVLRDIVMLSGLGEDAPSLGGIYLDAYGREKKQYILDRRHALCLASGYDVKLRLNIIDLCEELQAQAQRPRTLDEISQEAMCLLNNRIKEQEQEAYPVPTYGQNKSLNHAYYPPGDSGSTRPQDN